MGTGRSWLLQINPFKDPCSPAKLQKLRVGKGRQSAQRAYVLYIFTTVSIFIGFFTPRFTYIDVLVVANALGLSAQCMPSAPSPLCCSAVWRLFSGGCTQCWPKGTLPQLGAQTLTQHVIRGLIPVIVCSMYAAFELKSELS